MNKKHLTFILLTLELLFISNPAFAADTKVFFSPNGGCQQAVVDEINQAAKTIDVAMYDLTSREISQALISAKQRGIIIRVFMDKKEAEGRYSKSRYLAASGIEVRYYQGNGLMHNKFAVIDNRILVTGSFNWTASAQRYNQENLLIITDENVVKQYLERFAMLWSGPQDKSAGSDPGNLRVSGDLTVTSVNRKGF